MPLALALPPVGHPVTLRANPRACQRVPSADGSSRRLHGCHDPVAEVARPVQQLIAAARGSVDLPPGSARTVQFTLHADLTCYTGRAGRRAGGPG